MISAMPGISGCGTSAPLSGLRPSQAAVSDENVEAPAVEELAVEKLAIEQL